MRLAFFILWLLIRSNLWVTWIAFPLSFLVKLRAALVCTRRWVTTVSYTSFVWVLGSLIGNVHAARGGNVNYMVALSPDGSRVAIGKADAARPLQLFEGIFQQPLRPVAIPAGSYFTGEFSYSPDGRDLLFATSPGHDASVISADNTSPASEVERIKATDSLWRQRLGNDSAQSKIFEYAGISNAFPLLDGSIVFMGKVRRRKSLSPSPLFGGGYRVWTNYSWMLRKPEGSIVPISSREYAFYSRASLIRDEAVFFTQERYVNGRPLDPREYYLDVTTLKTGADLSALAPLGNMQDHRGGPSLQCDWAGKTCIRITAYDKNNYFAHRAEIIKNGKICKIEGMPDRLEHSAISRSGNAIALIVRPNPYRDIGYQLAYLTIDANGCVGETKFTNLPS